MTKLQRQVGEFHALFKLTRGETPAIRDPELRARLILEEALETVEALLGWDALDVVDEAVRRWQMKDFVSVGEHGQPVTSLAGVADGCADLLYVTYGTAVACGFDLEPICDLVHAANMAKVGGPVVNGKQLKPAGWQPPDVASELRRQGWRGDK